MKAFVFGLTALMATGLGLQTAMANDLMVASAMQRCTTNEECTLVTNSCSDNCGFVPVNKLNLESLQGTYQQRCGKPMEANPSCNLNPPISAACINSRCTIDYAYKNNADAKDYKPGAYPVPEQPVTDQAPTSAAPANDRQGFTAYDLPQNTVHQNTMGQIVDKVYVPPQAPVSGGNYVPVGSAAPAATPAPAATTPAAPPAQAAPYAPTNQSYATPPEPVPATPAAAPVPRAPAPANDIPASQPRRTPPPVTQPTAPVAVPAPAPVPTTTTTPAPIATPADPIPSSAPDTIKEPRVPEPDTLVKGVSPETGHPNAPIPPSDFKEKPLAPPPGATIPVGPNDPGALPPPNVVLQPPTGASAEDAAKSFTATTKKQDESFN